MCCDTYMGLGDLTCEVLSIKYNVIKVKLKFFTYDSLLVM